MEFFLISIILFGIIFIFKKSYSLKSKNNRVNKFKKKSLSKESNIQKIFSRDDEKTFSNPNININIGLYDNSETVTRKSNIHRGRLSKFNKSKLNGEMIYLEGNRFFKIIDGRKIYL